MLFFLHKQILSETNDGLVAVWHRARKRARQTRTRLYALRIAHVLHSL